MGTGTTGWHNWAGNQRCSPAVVERPRDVEEVSAAVKHAADAGRTVRVSGSGHSFTDAVLTDGTLVDLGALTGAVEVDGATGMVTVPAGMRLHDLNRRLATHGLAMANLGDIDVQTIAGAISTGTHGTGARLGGLATQVRGARAGHRRRRGRALLADRATRSSSPPPGSGSARSASSPR